ncbi:MAG: hypothetical protein L0G46_11125 [Kocuria sp.]|nr:hypothetical protein [Kocuria sp.]
MPVVNLLADQAAAFMRSSGYSPGSSASYRRVWDQFGDYCVRTGTQDPNRDTAAQFCTEAGADGPEQSQVFFRRAVSCLFDIAETGQFSLRAGHGRIPVCSMFTQEYSTYTASLETTGLASETIRSKTGRLRRLLAFLADHGVQELSALQVKDVSAYVR